MPKNLPWCLPPDEAEKFKRAVLAGNLDLETLDEMPSADRIRLFAKHFGKDIAPQMNRELEKQVLKNQVTGIVKWAQTILAGEKNKAARDQAIADAQALTEPVRGAEKDKLAEKLLAYKMRSDVTYDEAVRIAELADKVQEAKAAMDAGGDRRPWAIAAKNLRNYVGGLEQEARSFKMSDLHGQEWWRKGITLSKEAVHSVGGLSRSINAAFDNSAILRQGAPVLAAHPSIWARHARGSFANLLKGLKGQDVINAVDIEIMSRPTYDLMVRAGLDIGTDEEMFPTHLPAKIPIAGMAYTASEETFSAFQRLVRADAFDKLLTIAKKSDVDVSSDEELQAIGTLVNSLTGRGAIPKAMKGSGVDRLLRSIFFSPSFMKARADRLLIHPFAPKSVSGMTDFTKRQAQWNLAKWGLMTAVVLGLAKALGADVGLNPCKTDFMRIRVGKHVIFDPTQGASSDFVTAARLLFGCKEDKHGKVIPMKGLSDMGPEVLRYSRNKMSPVASAVTDTFFGQRSGKPQTAGNVAGTLLTPLPAKNAWELLNDPKVTGPEAAAGIGADFLGVSVGDYAPKQ